MHPLVYLPQFRLIICSSCGFACISDEVETHLRTRHRSIKTKERESILRQVQNIPEVIRKRSELEFFQFPPATTAAIPYLEPPLTDGMKCLLCPYIARQIQKIQAHCRHAHGWKNPRKRGRQVASQSSSITTSSPWRTGVSCQRFFKSREASGWFEVERHEERDCLITEEHWHMMNSGFNDVFLGLTSFDESSLCLDTELGHLSPWVQQHQYCFANWFSTIILKNSEQIILIAGKNEPKPDNRQPLDINFEHLQS